jgi:hypothetical protein
MLLKNAHQSRASRDFPHPPRVMHGAGLLQRTSKYASFLRASGALHLGIFEQPEKKDF